MDISVIVPCFNVGRYLTVALDNLLKQKGRNIEFLFINDGSTEELTNSILPFSIPE